MQTGHGVGSVLCNHEGPLELVPPLSKVIDHLPLDVLCMSCVLVPAVVPVHTDNVHVLNLKRYFQHCLEILV